MSETYKGQARRIAAERKRSDAIKAKFERAADLLMKLQTLDVTDGEESNLMECERILRVMAKRREGAR